MTWHLLNGKVRKGELWIPPPFREQNSIKRSQLLWAQICVYDDNHFFLLFVFFYLESCIRANFNNGVTTLRFALASFSLWILQRTRDAWCSSLKTINPSSVFTLMVLSSLILNRIALFLLEKYQSKSSLFINFYILKQLHMVGLEIQSYLSIPFLKANRKETKNLMWVHMPAQSLTSSVTHVLYIGTTSEDSRGRPIEENRSLQINSWKEWDWTNSNHR